MTYNKRSFVIK